MKDITKTG